MAYPTYTRSSDFTKRLLWKIRKMENQRKSKDDRLSKKILQEKGMDEMDESKRNLRKSAKGIEGMTVDGI